MQNFNGFPKRDKSTAIPETFFSELLPLIDDLAELKLTLFFMWALQQREGQYRHLTLAELEENEMLMDGLQTVNPDSTAPETLIVAIEKAITRGTLLQAEIPVMGEIQNRVVYLMNTERGREAVDAINNGDVSVLEDDPAEILPPRPNVFRLYEQEIGALTPMIAEGLKDLVKDYSADWVRDAIRVSTEQQARNIKYIRAVLERWRKEGKHEITGRHESVGDDGDGRRFIAGQDAAWIER